MPELPEVETTKNQIAPYLEKSEIECVKVRQNKLRWLISEKIVQLQKQKVRSLFRRGKYIILELETGYLVIHLGMTGLFKIVQPSKLPEKHDHIDLILNNGWILRYNDVRRFGSWQWVTHLDDFLWFKKMGVEPLSENFTSSYLSKKLKNKKTAIKIAIMNSEIVVGVGNIYASEALFFAKIHPEVLACQLSEIQIRTLVDAIKKVLIQAISAGGTTIKDFQQPNGKIGYFVQYLKVYGRKGQKCFQCDSKIESKIIGQRSSFYCPNCQKKMQVNR